MHPVCIFEALLFGPPASSNPQGTLKERTKSALSDVALIEFSWKVQGYLQEINL
jgi:hypothetical protein